MIAFDAIDAAGTDIAGGCNVLQQVFVGRHVNEVRQGKHEVAARGGVFGIIGYFLIVSALRYDPGKVRGLGGALESLAGQPFGKVLLGIVAAGLAIYGFYMLVEAKYHRIRAK